MSPAFLSQQLKYSKKNDQGQGVFRVRNNARYRGVKCTEKSGILEYVIRTTTNEYYTRI